MVRDGLGKNESVTVTAVTLLRHATIVVEIAGRSIVVDPMLDPAGARGPIENSPEPRDNPLVDLPSNVDEVLTGLVAAVVTHLHADHLDDAGARFLGRERLATFGQAADLESLAERGVAPASEIGGGAIGEVRLHRTDGEHGVGEIGERLGPVSGVVLEHGDDRIYIAGDTIPCSAVDAAVLRHDPTTVVLNAGGARFLVGDPITMTALDVVEFGRRHPAATVVAVHMDAINHCLDTRAVLKEAIGQAGVENVLVPGDGVRIVLPAKPSHRRLRALYDAFNARDVEATLAAMTDDVDWPNAWEGGRVRGHQAVRDYWKRQWEAIDPHVEPITITTRPDGRVAVEVHQTVRGLDGSPLGEGRVNHVYTIRDGKIQRMEVEEL